MPQRYAERRNIMLTSFELKMVLRSRNRGVFPMTQTRRTTNRTFDPRDQFIYLRSALGTVVTGIFLMAAGNATAMPQVMGGFDQSPETIVQKVACLSIGPVTSCRHGSGDNLFKTQKNKKRQSKRGHGGSPNWNHAGTPQKDNSGSAQTDAAPTKETQPVFEDFDAVTRGALINF
jgi:hypothetical protein